MYHAPFVVALILIVFTLFKISDYTLLASDKLMQEYNQLELLAADNVSEEKHVSRFLAKLSFKKIDFNLTWAVINRENTVTPSSLKIKYIATNEELKVYDYIDYFFIEQVKYDSVNGRVFAVIKGGSPVPFMNSRNIYMYVWDIENKKLINRYHLKTLPNK